MPEEALYAAIVMFAGISILFLMTYLLQSRPVSRPIVEPRYIPPIKNLRPMTMPILSTRKEE
jgi:hypothetical protein